jgi:hypothetical protein
MSVKKKKKSERARGREEATRERGKKKEEIFPDIFFIDSSSELMHLNSSN